MALDILPGLEDVPLAEWEGLHAAQARPSPFLSPRFLLPWRRAFGEGCAESQDRNTNRYDLKTGQSRSIRPTPPFVPPPTPPAAAQPEAQGRGAGAGAGAPAAAQAPGGGGGRGGRGAGPGDVVPPPPPGTNFRFFWSTPFMLSHHDPSTVYLGGDRLFKSTTRGDTWTASPDLTKNIGRNDRPVMGVPGIAPMASKHDGAASYSNIVTIGESPLVPGIIWVGTNDGNVQVSRDGRRHLEERHGEHARACPTRRTSRAWRRRT